MFVGKVNPHTKRGNRRMSIFEAIRISKRRDFLSLFWCMCILRSQDSQLAGSSALPELWFSLPAAYAGGRQPQLDHKFRKILHGRTLRFQKGMSKLEQSPIGQPGQYCAALSWFICTTSRKGM